MDKGPILYVEDDEDDIEILQNFLEKKEPDLKLGSFQNGHELMQYLEGVDDALLPCLIILDKNAPRISGLETMQLLKNNPRFHSIPIVLFSSGITPTEKNMCEQQGVATIGKPDSMQEWDAFCGHILSFCQSQLS
jgi:CheY-like chemotaxis protein